MKFIYKLFTFFLFSCLLIIPNVSQAACQLAPTTNCSTLQIQSCNVIGCAIVMPTAAYPYPCAPSISSCAPLTMLQCFGNCQWFSVANNNTGGGGVTNNNLNPPTNLENPLGDITSPQLLIGKLIDSVLGIVGSIALLMFIFGGLTWMTSGGSAEKIKKGRDIIVWSAIGLIIIFASYGLVKFLILSIK